ncbi:MAG: phosphonate C-P lyase system protein PhnG [Pseudomonadota bacterium]
MTDQPAHEPSDPRAQQRVMGVLAASAGDELNALFETLDDVPDWQHLRPPETGLIMVRGRVGGEGAPFNFGEVTVTRAAITLADGPTGFSYALGRDRKKAEQAAIIHALWSTPGRTQEMETAILTPLEAKQRKRDAKLAEETAPTKVDFFTLMRGDD